MCLSAARQPTDVAQQKLPAVRLTVSGGSPAPSIHGNHMGGRSVGRKKKVRHHVNPLKDVHMKPLELPAAWADEKFVDPSLPLHVDIGCARGVFCLDLAAKAPEMNVLGLEIREVLAEAALEDARALGLPNAFFFACNANVNLRPLLEGAGSNCQLRSASIQFPDPWFKTRHHKRRVVQPALVTALADSLPAGGWLWMQSDVLEVACDMRETVRATEPDRLIDAVADFDDWSAAKPDALHEVATERERASAALERQVYRCLFHKP